MKIMRKINKFAIIGCIFAFSTVCFAGSSTVSKCALDSNEWGYVTSAAKAATGSQASVLVTDIYKADGSASNYSKIKVKVGKDGAACAETTATKGSTKTLTLSTSYQAKGTSLSLYGMGNDPALDCKVDLTFNAN